MTETWRALSYSEVDTSDAAEAGLFAVPALFITFRETLEAAIIISVLLGLLEKVHQEHMKKYVWIGVLSATALCVAAAIIILVLVNVLKEQLLDDQGILITEGVMSLVAAVLIAVVALTIGNVMAVHQKWEHRLAQGIEGEEAISKNSVLFLAFTSVVREGIETIIFFTGIGAAYPAVSLPIPAVVGAVLGALCGIALYKFGGKLTIVWFFRIMMLILVFIGAGVFTNGINLLQRAGVFGTWDPEEDRAPINQPMWDISSCCSLESSEFWVLMRVLFGYTPYPSPLEAIMYLSYHLCVWIGVYIKFKSQRRIDQGKPGYKQLLKEKIFGAKKKAVIEADSKPELVDQDLNAEPSSSSDDSHSDDSSPKDAQKSPLQEVNLV